MTFDFCSFFNTWLFCSVLNWFFGKIIQGQDHQGRFRHGFLTFLYWMIIFRLLLPANLIYGIPNPFHLYFHQIDRFLSSPFPDVMLTPYGLFSYIWLAGAAYALLKFHQGRQQEKEVGKGLFSRSETTTVKALIPDYEGPDYEVILSPDIETPFVYGFSRRILIPKNCYSEETLYYILCHETMHLFNQDVYYLYLTQILTRIYWWMPGISSLKKNAASMVELRVDGMLMDLYPDKDLIGYCEALLQVAHPDINPWKNGLGYQNAYIGHTEMLYPPITLENKPEAVRDDDPLSSLEVLAFGEPNTDLKTRISYNLSAHETPPTHLFYYAAVLAFCLLSFGSFGLHQLFPF